MVSNMLKQWIRLLEARATPRRGHIIWKEKRIEVVRSIWWDDANQNSFDVEIAPYFKHLSPLREYGLIVDAGAATGLFSIAAKIAYPMANVLAFEPSKRQRLLLQRNIRLNRMDQDVEVCEMGLWNRADVLAFRTHGAISSMQSASQLPSTLPFLEKVPVIALDEWRKNRSHPIDLLKMDIEGAEIEALQGTEETLRSDKPDLLIQAYHIREGKRTLERCAEFLQSCGYNCRESESTPGLLVASAR